MDLIRVQDEDFDLARHYAQLTTADADSGALVTFVGCVRADSDVDPVVALELEHYPAMTLASLESLVAEARSRWVLNGVHLVHRVGRLVVGDQIVLVAVASAHRANAFAAAEFIMDRLKTTAPFWKKEYRASGASAWVEAKGTDAAAARRWT